MNCVLVTSLNTYLVTYLAYQYCLQYSLIDVALTRKSTRTLLIAFLLVVQLFAASRVVILQSQGLSSTRTSVASYGTISYRATDDNARLRIDGTRIVNGYGEQVILRGFLVGGNEIKGSVWIDEDPFSYGDIDQIKSWGGNVVSFYGIRVDWIMLERGIIDEAYFIEEKLDPLVKACSDLKVYCIVGLGSWSWSSYFGQGDGMPEWMFEGKYDKTEADKWQSVRDFWDIDAAIQEDSRAYFIDVWRFLANRYRDNPYVLFSVWDEPLCGALDYEEPDELLRFGHSYARFMEDVVGAIRSTGANQIIIINKPYVGLSAVRPVDREVVWDNHAYIEEESKVEWFDRYVRRSVDKFIEDFGKPLFWGGFGLFPQPLYNTLDYQTILSNNVDLFAEEGICGQVLLTWGYLYGEYYYKLGRGLTAEQTQNLVSIMFA